MKLTDFTPGQAVVVQNKQYGKPFTQERIVWKVGRKYVTLAGPWEERFFVRHEKDDFLIQDVSAGEQSLLFPSETAYEEYCERNRLDKEIARKFSCGGSNLPLGKLRRIKEIIDEEDT